MITNKDYKRLAKYSYNNYDGKEQRIPNSGEKFMFFDDGKISMSRMFQATVLKVYNPDEVPSFVKEAQNDNNTDWLFIKDKETGHYVSDVYIECSIPGYDENHIWFARTQDGGFFSIDIQNDWQGGRLDVDGRLEGYLDSLSD